MHGTRGSIPQDGGVAEQEGGRRTQHGVCEEGRVGHHEAAGGRHEQRI